MVDLHTGRIRRLLWRISLRPLMALDRWRIRRQNRRMIRLIDEWQRTDAESDNLGDFEPFSLERK